MTTLPSTRSTAWHEAAHCAALCLAGLTPLVCRVDWPERTLLGSTHPDWEHNDFTPDTMYALLISVLQGPLNDGQRVDAWPIDPDTWEDGSHKDGEQAEFIAQWLGFDAAGVDWHYAIFRAQKLGRDRTFRRLVVEIAGALEDKEVLFQSELQQLTDAVLGEQKET